MQREELVSIIMPNYNKAKFIAESIESVIKQTYSNWELIIVDDISTDNSLEIIQSFSKVSTKISFHIRKSKKKGGSACRNIGIDKTKGEYIVFLDSDDLLETFCLQQRINIIKQYNELDFAVFPIGTFYKKIGDSTSYWIPPKSNHLKKFLAHELPWHTSSVIWRKRFIEKLKGFNENFIRLQDVELHTKALLENNCSYKVFRALKSDAYYRIDLNRIIDNPKIFLQKWIIGTNQYLEFFTNKLISSQKYKLTKYLKGSIISMLNQLLYQNRINHISKSELMSAIEELIQSDGSKLLLNNFHKKILILYCQLYQKKFYLIKGFNFTFKYFFIRL